MAHTQEGGVDCGLFAIAYAVELAYGEDPSGIIYDQASMRTHLTDSLVSGSITPFPRHRTVYSPRRSVDSTQHIDATMKWSNPKKPARFAMRKSTCDTVTTSNRFSQLFEQSTSHAHVRTSDRARATDNAIGDNSSGDEASGRTANDSAGDDVSRRADTN